MLLIRHIVNEVGKLGTTTFFSMKFVCTAYKVRQVAIRYIYPLNTHGQGNIHKKWQEVKWMKKVKKKVWKSSVSEQIH